MATVGQQNDDSEHTDSQSQQIFVPVPVHTLLLIVTLSGFHGWELSFDKSPPRPPS